MEEFKQSAPSQRGKPSDKTEINSVGSPVWCENDRASLFDDTQDAVPQEAPGFGVHSSGWLILQSMHPL